MNDVRSGPDSPTGPNREEVFAILRFDPESQDPNIAVSVKEVLPSFEEARRETQRLQELAKGTETYFWQATRFYPGGRKFKEKPILTDAQNVTYLPSAEARLPAVMSALQMVINETYDAALRIHEAQSQVEYVKVRFFDRGFNGFKASHLLLRHDYWEFAIAITRQLFEMVLNLEEILRHPTPDDSATRYLRFAALQDALHQKAALEYDIARGTPDPEAPPPEAIEQFCRVTFPEFLIEDSKGRIRWARSWSGLTTRQLAERSERRIHRGQYQALYSFLSTHIHAGPTAVAGSFRDLTGSSAGESEEERVALDNTRLREVAGLTLSLYMELWVLCSPPVPTPSIQAISSLGALVNDYLSPD